MKRLNDGIFTTYLTFYMRERVCDRDRGMYKGLYAEKEI